jgi:hypothetical protein
MGNKKRNIKGQNISGRPENYTISFMFNYQKCYIVLQLTMAGECLGSMRLRLLLQRPLRLQHRPPWVRYALHAAAATRPRLRRTKQRRPLWVRRALHAAAATRPRLRRAKQRRSLPRSPPPNHSWTKRQIPPKIRFRKFVKLTDHTAK